MQATSRVQRVCAREVVESLVSEYWTEQLRDLDTTTWNATVADSVARLTPVVVASLLSSNSPLPVPSFDEFVALAYAATFALESNAAFRSLYRQATKLGIEVRRRVEGNKGVQSY